MVPKLLSDILKTFAQFLIFFVDLAVMIIFSKHVSQRLSTHCLK